MEGKTLWQSRTFWVNVVAIVALIVQTYTGYIISPEAQLVVLGFVNTGLRLITKQPIEWPAGRGVSQDGFITSRLAVATAGAFLFGSLILLTLLILTGCASLQKESPEGLATKSLLTMKEAVVAAAVAGDGLCKQQILNADQCSRLAVIYRQAQPAYDLAAGSLVTALQVNNAEGWTRYQVASQRFTTLYQDTMALAVELRLVPALEGGAR